MSSKFNKVRSDQRKRQTGTTPVVSVIIRPSVYKTPKGPRRGPNQQPMVQQ